MRFALVVVFILTWITLTAQNSKIQLPFSQKNVNATRFAIDTLPKYTHCRWCVKIPGLSERLVTIPAGTWPRHKLLRTAFPGITLHDSSYYSDGQCVIIVYPLRTPSEKKPIDSSADVIPLPADTVSAPGYFDGFGHTPLLNSTSAVSVVGRRALDRIPSPDITDKFSPISSGVLTGAANPVNMSIRGNSSLFSYSSPLWVLDNFPSPGGLTDINPHDIDSITVLKDAASAAKWGSFSSNTVIVAGTSEGRYNQKPLITASITTTSTERPNLHYLPKISTDSFISAERQFFDHGYYDSYFNDPYYALSPAVQVLHQWKDKTLSDGDAHAQLANLAGHSLLADLNRYFYRGSVSRDCHISVAGGGRNTKYYLGAGLYRDNTVLQRNGYDRGTLHGSLTAHPFTSKLETRLSFNFSNIHCSLDNPGSILAATPYAALANSKGMALPVNYKYNSEYVDTSGLLDLHYRPLDELRRASNKYVHTNGYAQLDLTWHFRPDFSVAVLYRHDRGRSMQTNTLDSASFFVHDQVDKSAQLSNGMVQYGIPPGYMRFINDTFFVANNLRAQLEYKRRQLTAMAGIEISGWTTYGNTTQEYGLGGPGAITTVAPYDSYTLSTSQPASINAPVPGLNSRYISLFSSASYTWSNRLTVSGSLRNDASNNEGVGARHRWEPFWALGISRQMTKKFDSVRGKPGHLIRLRASYGCTGNISNRAASLATEPLALNVYGFPQTGVASPPDPNRRWERNRMLNLGIDLQLLQNKHYLQGRLDISLDVYNKSVKDLIGDDHLPPSSGVTDFWGNTAGIHGNGLDLSVTYIHQLGKKMEFRSNWLISVARDWVSHSMAGPQPPHVYVNGKGYPMVGKPVTALYSYKYAGLDTAGNPRGWLGGQLSTQYSQLQNDPTAQVVCSGTSQPQAFGHWLNTLSYQGFSLSVELTWKAAFVIRRQSVNYSDMANGLSAGESDYYRRWKRPGDEKVTFIPSLPIVNVLGRDDFFNHSEAAVVRGDFVRLQDCRLGYELTPRQAGNWRLKQALFYIYINNLGILWRANKYGIDPDAGFTNGLPAPRSWSVGTQISF